MSNAYRNDPLTLLDQLHNEMNRWFDRPAQRGDEQTRVVTADWVPPVDIREEQDRFVIYADVPGVDPKNIEITMENGVLSIRGERANGGAEAKPQFKRRERALGTFYRRFSMPDSADPERITAKGNYGVIEINIPKMEKVQPRKIAVEG